MPTWNTKITVEGNWLESSYTFGLHTNKISSAVEKACSFCFIQMSKLEEKNNKTLQFPETEVCQKKEIMPLGFQEKGILISKEWMLQIVKWE